jgi:hypothetical protein
MQYRKKNDFSLDVFLDARGLICIPLKLLSLKKSLWAMPPHVGRKEAEGGFFF